MNPSIAQLLAQGAALIGKRDDAQAEARLLLAHALRCDPAYLFAWPEATVEPEPRLEFLRMAGARAEGRPIAYLTGRREFWSLDLRVSPATLIPRAETETLVEQVLQLPVGGQASVIDLGTGSGAIALALASERPGWDIFASDSSSAALAVASDNARRLGLARVRFVHGDWFSAVPQGVLFDLIVSNPPYVAADDPHLAQGDLRFEPAGALSSGPDGLDAIRAIAADSPRHLRPNGWLVFEHGFDQGPAAAAILGEAGFEKCFCIKDMAGQPRISGGCMPTPAHAP